MSARSRALQHARAGARGLRQRRHRDERRASAHVAAHQVPAGGQRGVERHDLHARASPDRTLSGHRLHGRSAAHARARPARRARAAAASRFPPSDRVRSSALLALAARRDGCWRAGRPGASGALCARSVSSTGRGTAIKLPSRAAQHLRRRQRRRALSGPAARAQVGQSRVLRRRGPRRSSSATSTTREPRLTLTSDFLTYFQREERLLASLNVDATLPSGSNLKGPSLEFWRAIPKVRAAARHGDRPTDDQHHREGFRREAAAARHRHRQHRLDDGRQHRRVAGRGGRRPPRAHRLRRLALPRRQHRPASHDAQAARRSARKGRPFTLVGETIDVLSKERKLDRVLAKSKARSGQPGRDAQVGHDRSPDRRRRAPARHRVGKVARARRLARSQSMLADSVDVLMPNQRLQEMHAVGGAITEGAPDTVKFRTTERDRLTGDTIVAHFDTAASQVRDTTSKPKIRLLVSTGNATSLQHLPPRDTTLRVPAIVYVVGSQITVNFDSGAVQRVRGEGRAARGGHLSRARGLRRARQRPPRRTVSRRPRRRAGHACSGQRRPRPRPPLPPPTAPSPPATPVVARRPPRQAQ